jgi:hypothetical protein
MADIFNIMLHIMILRNIKTKWKTIKQEEEGQDLMEDENVNSE